MELGIWPSEYALGEKWFYTEYRAAGYKDSDIVLRLHDYKDSVTMNERQKRAKDFLALIGDSHGGSSALFGPIDRSKENVERIHAITLSMGADTGKHDHSPNAYNAAIVPLYVLQNQDGTYVAASGGKVSDKERAHHYADRSEAESHRSLSQIIVEG